MHEWTIADRILRIVSGEVNDVEETLTGIHLLLGESMTLSRCALRNALCVLGRKRGYDEFDVMVQTVPVRVSCSTCGYYGNVPKSNTDTFHRSVPLLDCPCCDAPAEVTEGGDVTVDRISVEDPE